MDDGWLSVFAFSGVVVGATTYIARLLWQALRNYDWQRATFLSLLVLPPAYLFVAPALIYPHIFGLTLAIAAAGYLVFAMSRRSTARPIPTVGDPYSAKPGERQPS